MPLLLFLLLSALAAAGSTGTEEWDYVEVRPGARMFFWLYKAPDSANKPLVLWLQGGPGGSSTGFGNFKEIGPLDVNLQPRSQTWANDANILFVDNPVGTGWSYVENSSLYVKNNTEIARDLVAFFRNWLALPDHDIYKTMPFYVFCESYGGKMGTGFVKALTSSSVELNLKGLALGDSWIDPLAYVTSWAPYLRALSLLDRAEEKKLNDSSQQAVTLCGQGKWEDCFSQWGAVETLTSALTSNVDWYNVLLHNSDSDSNRPSRGFTTQDNDKLSDLMNGKIRTKLGSAIPASVVWGGQSGDVFEALGGDFMRDVVEDVNSLLLSGVKVVVYNGQIDLICLTPGTEAWMNKLTWSGMQEFKTAKKTPVWFGSELGGFVRSHKNLSFYLVMNAGHMVPADNPQMALKMLQMITEN